MLLVCHHGLNQLHSAAQAQIAAVDAEIVAVHSAPLLGGIILIIGCTALVGLENQLTGFVRRQILALGNPLNPVFQRGTDKQAQQIGIVSQGVVRAAADDDAGALLGDVANGIERCQIHLLLQGISGAAPGRANM